MSIINWNILGVRSEEKKLLLCPICHKPFSFRALSEHLAQDHLPTNCLQIARCLNDKCTKKKDIFSQSFLTDHICHNKVEHKFLVPKQLCDHRIECQKVFDSLIEISIWLGFVNSNSESIYGLERQERLKKFINDKMPLNRLLKIKHSPLKTPACFVTEHFDEVKRNGGIESYNSGDMMHSYGQRSPAYDSRSPGRSPAASPGHWSFGGRSPGPSGRSPGPGGRSPGPGGRSPGRSPGYADYEEHARRVPSFISSQGPSNRLNSRENWSSRSTGATKRPAELPVKTEVVEEEPASPDSRSYSHSGRPSMHRAISGSTTPYIPHPQSAAPPASKRMTMSRDSYGRENSSHPANPYLQSGNSNIFHRFDSQLPNQSSYNPSSWMAGVPQSGYMDSNSTVTNSSSFNQKYSRHPSGPPTPALDKLFPKENNDEQKRRESSERPNNGYRGRRC